MQTLIEVPADIVADIIANLLKPAIDFMVVRVAKPLLETINENFHRIRELAEHLGEHLGLDSLRDALSQSPHYAAIGILVLFAATTPFAVYKLRHRRAQARTVTRKKAVRNLYRGTVVRVRKRKTPKSERV